ncbi:MAG TPA: SdiA-regulated domain-containing protein [Candidatus Limnocylindrales bacterium]|nr:SdiA-regulated domain-containing protein [Candidatus Limnocylindrales bacterium]
MRNLIRVLIIGFVFVNSPVIADEEPIPLKLEKALPVEGPENIQPSGLAICHNMLVTVSDKHDNTIFEVKLRDDKAVLVPYLQFKLSEPVTESKLDFEGITCDEMGNFYLISETAFRILRVSAKGEEVSWITPSLRSYGKEKGLFQVPNAYLEGIALRGPHKFVLAAERQPRGIMEVDIGKVPFEVRVFKNDTTQLTLPKGLNPDFSDLFVEDQGLYALERSAYAICKLVDTGQKFEERDCWSYKAIETREELQYLDMTFGKAEGLTMDKDHVFIILDNNNEARACDPNDRRPLLLIMERPIVKTW